MIPLDKIWAKFDPPIQKNVILQIGPETQGRYALIGGGAQNDQNLEARGGRLIDS